MQLMIDQSGTAGVVPGSFARKSGSVGTSVPLRPCLGNFPTRLLPLLPWLKLSLAYLTQAYVDFIPRQSEAVQFFKQARCGF